MDLIALGLGGLWAGLFASVMGILLTAPRGQATGRFLCAVAGCLARDVLMHWGLSQDWATAVGASVVVLVAVAVIRDQVVSPVVLISAVLPLGAAVAVFNAIVGIMKVSSLEGDALGAASTALVASVGKAFTISLAIALGLGVGVVLVRLVRREAVWERA